MALRTTLGGGLALTFALFAAACNDQANDAPIIDFVDAPLSVSAENGVYAIPMTIGFHDNNGEVVTHVRYRSLPSFDSIVEIRSPLPTRESAYVTLELPAVGAEERRQLEITIIDGRGAESLPLPRIVTLK